MVVTEIKKAWPVDEEIPSFRPHQVDEVVKLNDFVKRLSESKDSSKYVFPQCAFGIWVQMPLGKWSWVI